MTIITPNSGGFYYPKSRTMNQQGLQSTLVIDAADEAVGGVFQAPFTGTIDKLIFGTATVTTGATVDVRLETVSSGVPSGTLLGTNSNASQVIDAADDNTTFTVSLTTGVAVTKGQFIAFSIQNPSTSFGDMQIVFGRVGFDLFPYGALFTGTWAKQTLLLAIALEYSDGSYHFVPGVEGWTAGSSDSFDVNSSPDEIGNRLNFPFDARIDGFHLHGDIDGFADVVLYDSSDVAQLTLTLDPDNRSQTQQRGGEYTFDGTFDVAAGDFVRLVLKPTTTTNVSLPLMTFATAAAQGSSSGGTDIIRTDRTNAGAWTDTNTERMSIGLILSGFAGPGGGSKLIGVGGGLIP